MPCSALWSSLTPIRRTSVRLHPPNFYFHVVGLRRTQSSPQLCSCRRTIRIPASKARLRWVVRCALRAGGGSSGICCWRLFTLSSGRTRGHELSWRGELSITCEEQLSNLWSLGLFLQWTGLSLWPWFFGHCFTHGARRFSAVISAPNAFAGWIKHSLVLAFPLFWFVFPPLVEQLWISNGLALC